MHDYDTIRARLLARRDELNERLAKITDDVRHVEGPLNPDFAEQAVEREHEEVLDALGEAGRVELSAINQALARIDSGDYGICIGCGDDIAPGRLEVLPFSTMCVSCAEKADAAT